MIKEIIICDAKTNTVTTEFVEDNTPEYIDYQSEIDACKKRLAETDYVVIKIAEGAATRDEYESVIDERAALRERINELEQLSAEQEAVYGN